MSNPSLTLNVGATDIVQAYTDDCRECALALAPEREVSEPNFSWDTWDVDEQFEAQPNLDETSRRSEPNSVDFTSTQQTGRVKSYALQSAVPQDDVEDARSKNPNLDPINFAAEALARRLWRHRLRRVMDIYKNPANYAQTITPAAADKLSNRTSPVPDWIKYILDQADKMLLRPNTLVCSNREVWTALRTHPSIVEGIKLSGAGRNEASGTVMESAIAELFEVERVIVCRNLINTTRKVVGSSQQKGPISQDNFISLVLLDPISRLEGNVPSFVMTALYRPLQAFTVFDPIPGVEGVTKLKVGWRGVEVVKSTAAGFLIRDVL